jgi:hypothetical protein
VASKLTTGKEDTLVTAIDSLTTAMRTAEGQSALTGLGLNVAQLQGMKPEDALQAVFQSVKGKGTGVGFEYLQKSFSQVTGLSDKDYATATKQGAAFESFYNEFLSKYADVDFSALARGSEAMVKFQSQLDIQSSKFGGKIADPLSRVLDELTPWLDKFTDWLADLIGSITQEDVDNFMNNVQKVFNFVAGIAEGIGEVSKEGAAQEAVADRNAAFKKGDIGGALGYDAKALLANTLQGVKANLGYVFSPEDRMRQQLEQKEPFLREMLKTKGQKFTNEQMGWLEQLGYVKGGQLTEKAQALKIEIIVKDPAGNVLSSSIQTQSKPTPPSPMRTPAKKGG